MAWIAVQLLAIGYRVSLQPLIFVLGAVIAGLAWQRPAVESQ